MRLRLILSICVLLLPGAVRAQQPSADVQAQALFVEALTRAFLEDHEGAISRLREVLELVPGQPTVLSALAENYAATGQASLAQATADEAAEHDPQNPHFALTAARIAAERGDLTGAQARYEALLERHPDQPQALGALAALHERRGAHAEAASILERLPTDADVLERLLGHYERLGDDAAFLRTYERLAALRSPGPALLERLGAHHQRHDRPGAARAAFEAALRHDPAAPVAREALAALGAPAPEAAPSPGLAAYAAGRFDEAARLLQQSLDLDPRDPHVWAQAAMAYLENGQPGDAARVIEDGRLIFFDHPALTVAAAYEALARGDAPAAAALLAEISDEATEMQRAALLLARAHMLRAQGRPFETERDAALTLVPLDVLRAHALAPMRDGW